MRPGPKVGAGRPLSPDAVYLQRSGNPLGGPSPVEGLTAPKARDTGANNMNNGGLFRNLTCLVSIILGLVLFSGPSPARADDPIPQMEISSVQVDRAAGKITIFGHDFDNGDWPPTVALDVYPLRVDEPLSSADTLVTYLDFTLLDDRSGVLMLTVVTGDDLENYAEHCLFYNEAFELVDCEMLDEGQYGMDRRTFWRVPVDPHGQSFTELAYKFGPVEVSLNNRWGDPVYYQLLKDYTIDLTPYFTDVTPIMTDRCQDSRERILDRLPLMPTWDWPHEIPVGGAEYIELLPGPTQTLLKVKKGYRWDGPSLQVSDFRVVAKPASNLHPTLVHDVLYDLMRLEIIERDKGILVTPDGWTHRKMADCMFYMLARQAGMYRSKVYSNFDTIRSLGKGRLRKDLPDWKSHSVADPGSDQSFTCAPSAGITVTLDGTASKFADSHSWKENGVEIATGPSPSILFSPGVHTVSLTTDHSNFSDEYSADTEEVTITVEADTQEPWFTQAEDVVDAPSEPGECGAHVDFYVTADDDCGCPHVTCIPEPGSWFPVGTTTVTCTATDGAGNALDETLDVTVVDVDPPVITGITSPIQLWPPNHRYATLAVADFVHSVSDNCSDLSLDSVVITGVTSSEPEDVRGRGDGRTKNDFVIEADGKSVKLRKERQGGGDGRIYTVFVEASDPSGNAATASFEVHVPHSR